MWQSTVEENLEPVYRLAASMTLDPEDREAIVVAAFSSAARSQKADQSLQDSLLGEGARLSEEQQRRRRHHTFETWDAQLRAEQPEVDEPPVVDEKELWRLRRRCLVTTLCCLPAGERVAFALAEPLRLETSAAAKMLGISSAALRVRLSRARNKVARFLGPRCCLIDARNPCQCRKRLAAGIAYGLKDADPMEEDVARLNQPVHEALALYHCCNERPPAALHARVVALGNGGAEERD